MWSAKADSPLQLSGPFCFVTAVIVALSAVIVTLPGGQKVENNSGFIDFVDKCYGENTSISTKLLQESWRRLIETRQVLSKEFSTFYMWMGEEGFGRFSDHVLRAPSLSFSLSFFSLLVP